MVDVPVEKALYTLSQPTAIELMLDNKKQQHGRPAQPGGAEFKAIDVACGPYSTWVVGRRSAKANLVYDDDVEGRTILKKLRDILRETGTLVRFFELHREEYAKVNAHLDDGHGHGHGDGHGGGHGESAVQDADSDDSGGSKRQSAQESSSSDDDGDALSHDAQHKIEALAKRDPFTLTVGRDQFREIVFAAGFCEQAARIRNLAKAIAEQKHKRPDRTDKCDEDDLVLGDIEDYALGFMQHNTKLFMFGQAAKPLRCFEHAKPNDEKITAIAVDRLGQDLNN